MSRIVALVEIFNSPIVWEDILPGILSGAPKVIPRLLPLITGHLPVGSI